MTKSRIWKRIILCLLCVMLLCPSWGIAGSYSVVSVAPSPKKKAKKKTKKIFLNKKSARVAVGKACKLKVKNAQSVVKWSVNDKNVVRIKTFGKRILRIYGKREGTAVVTAKVGSKKMRCVVTVVSEDTILQDGPGWNYGTWEDNCYYNGSGTALGNLDAVMMEDVPYIQALGHYPYLYIGASRTKNTARAVKDKKVFFYYCSGAGFYWFFNPIYKTSRMVIPALTVIRSYLYQRPSGTVIIDLGGNDVTNIEAYIGLYRSLMEYYPMADFRFMGILPRAKRDPSNNDRKEFNLRLEAAFPGQVINLYGRVYRMPEFETVDGVHYGKILSRKIYVLTMKALGRKIRVNKKNGKITG